MRWEDSELYQEQVLKANAAQRSSARDAQQAAVEKLAHADDQDDGWVVSPPADESMDATLLGGLAPLIALFVLFYFLLIRPQMKRSKEQRQMIEKIAKGDELVLAGGLAGKVVNIGELYLTVEVADGVNVKVQKSAVTSVLPKGTLKSA